MSRIKIYKIKPNTTIEDLRWSKDQISNLSTKKLLTHFNRIRKTKYFVFSTGWCCSGKCFHNTEYDDIEWTYKKLSDDLYNYFDELKLILNKRKNV